MDAAALQAMLGGIDWDEMFGFSSFAFKNIRRKADARAYPSRLEFGVKSGIVLPPSLNNGQQVDLLITAIAAPYFAEPTFATLPTPFKVVAVDLRTAEAVVLDRGSLARAMRATMSLPGVFPPVEVDGQVLVDGGAMNNVPADVVRAMGADTVIAVNVGDLGDQEDINYSIFGLAGATIDAMMRANTKTALTSADVVLNVPLQDYGSLAWRQSDALIEEGYKAAEAMKDTLLRYAVSDEAWRQWQAHRAAARKVSWPQPAFVTLEGVSDGDEGRMNELLAKHIGKPLDVGHARTRSRRALRPRPLRVHHVALQRGRRTGATGLAINAIDKRYAPPFLMLGVNLENTTSDQFQLSLTGRYLRFDVLGSGSELRLDAIVGADPGFAAALYRPIWRALFVVPYAGVSNRTFNVISDDAIVARYSQTTVGHRRRTSASISVATVTCGWARRLASSMRASRLAIRDCRRWPARRRRATSRGASTPRTARRFPRAAPSRTPRSTTSFDGPNPRWRMRRFTTERSSVGLPQLAGEANRFWRKGERTRLFVLGGAGTSFDHQPLLGGSVSTRQADAPWRLQRGRDPWRSLRDRHRRPPSRVGPDAGLSGRPHLRRRLARERRCLRRLGRRDAANPCEWRPDPRHPGGPGDARGQRGVRRPLANVYRHRPVVPLSRHTSP